MIDSIHIDWLKDGALPIYEIQEGGTYYAFQPDRGGWNPYRARRGRAFIPIDIDAELLAFENALQGWLNVLNELMAGAVGTLIFTIRSCWDQPGIGRFILAAMAYTPERLSTATDLNGASAADLLLQVCRGLCGQDSERLHPALRDAFDREMALRTLIEAERLADEAATLRSRQLLESFLTPEQQAELQVSGVFHVRLVDGRLFQISQGFGHNVHLIENGERTIEYCIVTSPDERIPLFDQMLAQKVLLEVAPEDFFRTANFRNLKASDQWHSPAGDLTEDLDTDLDQFIAALPTAETP